MSYKLRPGMVRKTDWLKSQENNNLKKIAMERAGTYNQTLKGERFEFGFKTFAIQCSVKKVQFLHIETDKVLVNDETVSVPKARFQISLRTSFSSRPGEERWLFDDTFSEAQLENMRETVKDSVSCFVVFGLGEDAVWERAKRASLREE